MFIRSTKRIKEEWKDWEGEEDEMNKKCVVVWSFLDWMCALGDEGEEKLLGLLLLYRG